MVPNTPTHLRQTTSSATNTPNQRMSLPQGLIINELGIPVTPPHNHQHRNPSLSIPEFSLPLPPESHEEEEIPHQLFGEDFHRVCFTRDIFDPWEKTIHF